MHLCVRCMPRPVGKFSIPFWGLICPTSDWNMVNLVSQRLVRTSPYCPHYFPPDLMPLCFDVNHSCENLIFLQSLFSYIENIVRKNSNERVLFSTTNILWFSIWMKLRSLEYLKFRWNYMNKPKVSPFSSWYFEVSSVTLASVFTELTLLSPRFALLYLKFRII